MLGLISIFSAVVASNVSAAVASAVAALAVSYAYFFLRCVYYVPNVVYRCTGK